MKTSRHLLCWICAVVLGASMLPLRAETPLKVGDTPPLFWCKDQDGVRWKLADHIGKNVVFLYFYPKDDTAGCTAEACSLRDNMYELAQQGVIVAGISFDDQDTHKNFVFKYNLDFPLLADTNGVLADAYGVRKTNGGKMDRRVSFLIGLDGKIIHVTDSPDPSEHVKQLALAMAKLRAMSSH